MKIIKKIEDYSSFSEILNDASTVYGEKVFLVENDKEYTYKNFNSLVNRCCQMMINDGLRKGDIVSIIIKNSVDYLLLYFGALRLGCRINPFPFHLGTDEIIKKLKFIVPKIVYTHDFHSKKMVNLGFRIRTIQSDKENILLESLEDFRDKEPTTQAINPDDTAFMYYSSGTTGSPKIIEYSTKSEIITMASLIRSGFIEPELTHLCMLPLGHTAAIRYTILPCLLTGSKVVLCESFWKIRAELWKLIDRYKVTFFEVVPSILIAILNTPYKNLDNTDISSLKFIGCGSAYLSKNLQDNFERKFKIPVANMYGLSETGPTHFDNPFLSGRHTGNIGKPLDIMDIKVLNETGHEIESGKIGEFAVKGPSLLKGYYKDDVAYKSCFRNGYFLTGDIGYEYESGVFYYVDRKKDLIIKGGVNIVPSQIDEVLLSHKSIKEAATIGKPDMFLGETIKSYIVLADGCNVDANSLKIFCRERLGEFKTPSSFEFIEELPKGPSGKILRRKLREKELTKILIL